MKITLVTGASSGIGRAIAIHFSKLNHKVIATARRSDKLEETKNLGKSENIIPVISDISTTEGKQAIISKLQELNVKVDYLVQNAGVLGEITDIENITEESWRKSFEINVHGPLFLTKLLMKHDLFAVNTRILHMGSGAAGSALKGWPSYCVTKAAFLMLYKYLKAELVDKKIHVGSVKPGVVSSEMQDSIRKGNIDVFPGVNHFTNLKKNEIKELKPHTPPTKGLDTPENIAYFTEYLFLQTTNEEFSQNEWDIRDKYHQSNWIKN